MDAQRGEFIAKIEDFKDRKQLKNILMSELEEIYWHTEEQDKRVEMCDSNGDLYIAFCCIIGEMNTAQIEVALTILKWFKEHPRNLLDTNNISYIHNVTQLLHGFLMNRKKENVGDITYPEAPSGALDFVDYYLGNWRGEIAKRNPQQTLTSGHNRSL